MERGKTVYTWKEFVAWCFQCGNIETLHFHTIREAIAAFRGNGWRTRKGKWICSLCASSQKEKELL